jgi:recombinational DNA repair ATPase RecF
MDKIKFWVNAFLKLALILLAGYVIYSWNGHKSGSSIDAEVLKKIDSLCSVNNSITIDNEKLKLTNENLIMQVSGLDDMMQNVKPVFQKKIADYNSSSKEIRAELVKAEYDKRLKEKVGEK